MPAKLAEVAMRAPRFCGECPTCRSVGDVFGRFREFLANLEEGEVETTEKAVRWCTEAYPPCPAPPKRMRVEGVSQGW